MTVINVIIEGRVRAAVMILRVISLVMLWNGFYILAWSVLCMATDVIVSSIVADNCQ